MIPRLSLLRKAILGGAVFFVLPVVVACGSKKTAVVDAGLVATASATPTTVNLVPEEDAAVAADAADAADAGKKGGVGVSTNVLRLRQCCGQLRTQAKPILATPEGQTLLQAATQCDVMAAQAGAKNTSAPELGILKTVLAGRNIPPFCQGF